MPDQHAHAHDHPPVSGDTTDKPPLTRDLSRRIKGMGIFQIILGCLCLLFILLSLLGAAVGSLFSQSGEETGTAALLSSIATYLMTGLFFFAVGIGSLTLKRWVRPLVLSMMWPGLVLGVVGFGIALFLIPQLLGLMALPAAATTQIPNAIVKIVEIVALGLIFVIGVLIPGLHVAVYHGRRAKETLEAYDPIVRWTDRCPTTVIGIVITLVCLGVMQLVSLAYGLSLFFGLALKGPVALGEGLIEMGICLVAAFLVYKLNIKGYWITLSYLVFVCAKNVVSFLVLDLSDMYRLTGVLDESRLAQTEQFLSAVPTTVPILILWLLAALSAVLYMWGIKKHFKR